MPQAFDALIVEIDVRNLEATLRGNGVGQHLELVVLGRDGHAAGLEIAHRMIATMVAIRQPARGSTGSQPEHLVTETDAHHWRARLHELLQLFDHVWQFGGITGTVRDEYALWFCFEDRLR